MPEFATREVRRGETRSTVYAARFEMADPASARECCEVDSATDMRRSPEAGAAAQVGTAPEVGAPKLPATNVPSAAEVRTAAEVTPAARVPTPA